MRGGAMECYLATLIRGCGHADLDLIYLTLPLPPVNESHQRSPQLVVKITNIVYSHIRNRQSQG